MFETAELDHRISKKEYRERVPGLREELLEAQVRLREMKLRVVVLFAGVDGAGKGETANLLNEWMDPHLIVTRAYAKPTKEERERPFLWRFWRDMPWRGQIGVFLSAWYSQPLLDRVYGKTDEHEFDDQLDDIISFERTLRADGLLVLKFWMHLSKAAQRKRFETLEADPLQKWRVTKRDWKHWKLYDRFIETAEHTIARTSRGVAPWKIVDGSDHRYRAPDRRHRPSRGHQAARGRRRAPADAPRPGEGGAGHRGRGGHDERRLRPGARPAGVGAERTRHVEDARARRVPRPSSRSTSCA